MKVAKNKIIKWVIVAVIGLGIITASVLGAVSSCNENKAKQQSLISNTPADTVFGLRKEYSTNDLIFFTLTSQKDKEIVKATYSIDNASEVEFDYVGKGLSAEYGLMPEVGKYYVDTNYPTILTKGMSIGTHIVNFYVYTSEKGLEDRIEVLSETFKIVNKVNKIESTNK